MAKDAVFQVRMDADVKDRVERLYQKMGSSFADAVRMLAAQSLIEQGMPFKPAVKLTRGEFLSYRDLDAAQFDAEMERGFAQANAGEVLSAGEVMSEIRLGYDI